jgi:hypothetical protein
VRFLTMPWPVAAIMACSMRGWARARRTQAVCPVAAPLLIRDWWMSQERASPRRFLWADGLSSSWNKRHGSLGLNDILLFVRYYQRPWILVERHTERPQAGDPLRQHGLAGRGPIGVSQAARRAVSLAASGAALGTIPPDPYGG